MRKPVHTAILAIAASALLSATLLVTPASAEPSAPAGPHAPIQAGLDEAVSAGIPGMIASVHDERGQWRGASGRADIDAPDAPEPDGRFRVGSVSKTFTATLVLQLVDGHQLGLDDTIQQHLPGLLPYKEPITVRQLLQHASGLPRDLPPEQSWASLPEVDTERLVHFDPVEVVKASTSQPLLFAPGSGWSYSNTAYTVLAMLVEKTTRSPIDAVLRQRILRPLGLRDTSLVRDFPFLPAKAAHGYEQLYEPPHELTDVTTYNLSRYVGAGTVVSTGADLNRFFDALLGGELLSAGTLADMRTTVPATTPDGEYAGFDYGLGIARFSLNGVCQGGPTVWGHNGSVPGYGTWSLHTADGAKHISTMGSTSLTNTPEQRAASLRAAASEFCPNGAGAVPERVATGFATATGPVQPR